MILRPHNRKSASMWRVWKPNKRESVKRLRYLSGIRDDIVRSIKTLKPLSSGFEILIIGNRRMVRSVPKELDTDQSSLLLLSQVSRHFAAQFNRSEKGQSLNPTHLQTNGFMTKGMIETELKWHEGRIRQALVSHWFMFNKDGKLGYYSHTHLIS